MSFRVIWYLCSTGAQRSERSCPTLCQIIVLRSFCHMCGCGVEKFQRMQPERFVKTIFSEQIIRSLFREDFYYNV